jgi:hypothetical protein
MAVMSAVNDFLLQNNLRLNDNPCVSADFCLDWPALSEKIRANAALTAFPASRFAIAGGTMHLVSDDTGDSAWIFEGGSVPDLEQGVSLAAGAAFPATYVNLVRLKNLVQEADPEATIFPTASGSLPRRSLGIGSRFTTLHWPGVAWAMRELGLSVTACQNSIPRELVYDTDEMMAGRLGKVAFPFIGCDVPEGHQGHSVQGLAHGAILTFLKSGFHQARLPWGFNADHQPIGGSFDEREDKLVEGSLFASYITFDLSPELTKTVVPDSAEESAAWVENNVPAATLAALRSGLSPLGVAISDEDLAALLCTVWPALVKMKKRDEKYRAARVRAFTTEAGRAYVRELSVDELPGLTTPETLATLLVLCREMDMPVQFAAPAFGFQKNLPYPDNKALEEMIGRAWRVCEPLGVSIGFHSGSGKSAENYRVLGAVTGGNLEIKTSGRYTYEMGRALAASSDPADQALWNDWHAFTRELAVNGAFSADATEQRMAREFIRQTLDTVSEDVFTSPAACSAALAGRPASPEDVFWFEYNFLYVLAAEGRADKASLGDHSAAGYRQRARFYTISAQARNLFAKRVADYIIFLAETTGLAGETKAEQARQSLKTAVF